MSVEHSRCRACAQVVRVDWDACFHCGARGPVARPGPKRALDLLAAFVVLYTITMVTVRVGSVWSHVRADPQRFLEGLARALPGSTAAAVTPAAAAAAAAAPATDADRPRRTYAGGVTPLTPPRVALATVGRGPAVRADTADTAALAFDRARVAQAIAAAPSVAALDSLEARLEADYPRDPALRREGRVRRQLAARRVQLAGR